MSYSCPACQRTFDEPGFCPYDGKQLVELAVAQKPTVVSEMIAAQAGPRTVEDPNTIDDSLTKDPTNQVRAISAADSATKVIAQMRRDGPPPSEYDRLVGETLDGRYFVQRKIGEGGMGVVFAAKHAVIERPLAIKVLKREVARDTATIKRFVQEAKAASRIGHPNIVDVTDFGTTPDGMTYSVMEYVDGKTLSKAIKEGAPFPPERSIRIAMQIARALGAAHDKGIVHRDLKPENVFLIDRDERPDFVKIVDFGIAKVQPIEGADPNAPRLTRAGSVFGTPEYMAPEQAAGRSDTDRRVDIYALGTILYEMTCGRVPHKSDSTVRTIAMQMLDPIQAPSQVHPDLAVPKPLELAIMKALEKKREQRFQTMGELIAALENVLHYMKTTSQSTLSLPPLPPGADPNLTPSPGVPLLVAKAGPNDVTNVGAPRRAKPETRPLHEPAFAARVSKDGTGSSLTLPEQFVDEPEPEPRRWPLAVVALLLLGGGAATWYIATRADKNDIATGGHDDAGLVRTSDATLIATVEDAGVASADANELIGPNVDAGVHARHDAGVGSGGATIPAHPKKFTMEILTRPGEANVFVGRTFRGPSGVHLTEAWGTRLEIECRAPHFKGKVTVVFDGTRDSAMCTATRLPFCVPGLKNPIDDCEERAGSDLGP